MLSHSPIRLPGLLTQIKYVEGGERAVAAFDAGVAGYEARAFRGMGVFVSTPYEVSDDADSVQMLQRSSQVGEFYRMSPPAVWNPANKLDPNYMDLMIFDEESDQLKHITFAEAINAVGVADGDELGMALNWQGIATAPFNGAYVGNLNNTEKTALGGRKYKPVARDDLIKAVASGVWLPLCIVIARPFIEHLMMSAIATVSGRDTGATLFGPADMRALHTRSNTR